ncbi:MULTISPECIES: 7-cyano-7-deazaguanine synthase QueC [unclassified Paenibacillus]|uniref:7-cyano-7-deazaguanine synthase QueC n=1 Tax=unclassified Paenibacillus TaxID=185978 RepID=UPI001AE915A3|nr:MULTISPECIES: 7-cyano-7-deazaguanine synthase QueC [unclassified Paenibacillus]MBP1154801.1 7-cyano-7-deazaguanine synthase [Paenibacillus sp. PvP091]MBP1169815.1 7-cyano-7-deazaguanine synthase [Paenibacillus sp. PvR098]MBP2440843.1 7-cyano-7-deazaguanine synthase [Paenibacillus sp. PvP052]
MKKAVVILSGGLDSTTCMGIAQEAGYELFPITFDYGQRQKREIENARQVASFYGVADRHRVISLGFLKEFGGSALTDDNIEVPPAGESGGVDSDIPITYVPGRNLLFLSIATSYAEVSGAEAIYIGVNALDYSGYPDCRPEFIHKVEEVMALATRVGVEGGPIHIETPLIHWTKAEIIREGMRLGVPYQITTSCYNGQEEACGDCDSCRLRLKGFADAEATDPVPYRTGKE